ncbi:M15 family metallopeptidase [Glaciibacter sp. 2TAF33]|uniref:M15 family metallopeptidase n=1 Tax=Glaciibacter sp. 2TAF33 TaxID=3233015 RepID=UPI003F9314A2
MSPLPPSGGNSQPVRRGRALLIVGALLALAVGALAVGVGTGHASARSRPAPATGDPSALQPVITSGSGARPTPTETPDPVTVPVFNKSARSIDDPSSIWVVVDKKRPLHPVDYVPGDLVAVPVAHVWEPFMRREAAEAVVAMFAAFESETALRMQSQSAYRSYDTQVDVYNQDVASNGQAFADSSTARPGTSEHQTGLAMDISALPSNCSLAACFGTTAQGQWLAANAWRFGFLLRYPADKVAVTGYEYEPWHFRYIGVDLATQMHNTGVTTLEEFFGLPAAPGYD